VKAIKKTGRTYDGSERLAKGAEDERLERRHLVTGLEHERLQPFKHAVRDSRVDAQDERRPESAPESRDAVVAEDVGNRALEREALLGELLPRRDDADGDGKHLTERGGERSEGELGPGDLEYGQPPLIVAAVRTERLTPWSAWRAGSA
jgi:hypothetical protein